MATVISKIGSAVSTVETEIAKGISFVSHLYSAAEIKFDALMKDEPQIAAAMGDLVEKGELFLAASAPAITDKGLSLPADSAAFAAMTAYLKSFESAAGVMKIAIADLK